MKVRLLALCTILTLVVMLPVLGHAETQLEFELGCSLKTANACEVRDEYPEGNVIAYLPAGTYVRYESSMPGGWVLIKFWHNGGRAKGWAQVRTVAAMSDVRNEEGLLDSVHELDPDYEAKMQQGTAETDVRAGWTTYENDPFTADLEHVSPEEAEARVRQYAGSGSASESQQTADQQRPGTTSAKAGGTSAASSRTATGTGIALKAMVRSVSGKEAPEDMLAPFVYAPSSGKASLREASDNSSKTLAQCSAGTVVTVLEVGKTHTLVEVDGQAGYLRNDCLRYSVIPQEERLPAVLVGGDVNVRGGADKDSALIAQWPAGTQVTVFGVQGNWCEVEYEGMHGWVASKYVAVSQ